MRRQQREGNGGNTEGATGPRSPWLETPEESQKAPRPKGRERELEMSSRGKSGEAAQQLRVAVAAVASRSFSSH